MAALLSDQSRGRWQRVLNTALKIIQGAATAAAITVMTAGAPTASQGGNQVRSTVAQDPTNPAQGASVFAPTLPFVDRSKFAPRSGIMGANGFPTWVDRGTLPAVTLGRPNGYGYGFYTNALAFDVSVEATAGGIHRLQVKVNGQWAAASDVTVTSDGRVVYVKFTFPTAVRRLIEIYFTNSSNIRGINITPGATIEAAPISNHIRALFLSDSYGEITGSDRNRNVIPHKLAENLDWQDLITSPSSGTGWKATPPKNAFERRFDLLRVGELDYVIFWFYPNDRGQDPTAVRANVAAAVGFARDAQPHAIIHVFGPGSTATYKTPAAVEQAVADGVADAAQGDPRVIYSKTSHLITDANSATYIYTDQLHPNPTGAAMFADYARSEVIAGSWRIVSLG